MYNFTIPPKIFIDADAYVAIANSQDANHKLAIIIAKILAKKNIAIFTSNFAFGEAVTVVSQKVALETASRMGYDIPKGVTIIDVNSLQREKALERFSQQTSKNTRFTDMVNMVLMDELGITTVFSFDKHYRKNGYKLLGEK